VETGKLTVVAVFSSLSTGRAGILNLFSAKV
jgi:hypothetical protein